MQLSYSGIDISPTSLVDEVYLPERQGSFAVELRAAARTHGRLPYKIEPTLKALTTAINEGYPVLILQNLGLGFYPKWHFAVTIGIDRPNNNFILRSGDQRRLEIRQVWFERRWRLADYWGIILLRPGDLPDWVDQAQYEYQLAQMEDKWAAHLDTVYKQMNGKWPGSIMALLGLGNQSYNKGDLKAAAGYYQSALEIDRDQIAALNNLAQVRFELEDYTAAKDLICRAIPLADGHPLQHYINELEQELKKVMPDFNCTLD